MKSRKTRALTFLYFFFGAFYGILYTFAAVNVKKKRHIASWMLLAVFVPMLILSSVHIHPTATLIDDDCSECTHHQCHGHLGVLTTTMHDCVLCQFLTLTFVAAAVFAVVLFNKVCRIHIALRQQIILHDVWGITSLRAPPFV